MTAYGLVMGTLLLTPWLLLGTMVMEKMLQSAAASLRRPRPVPVRSSRPSKRGSL